MFYLTFYFFKVLTFCKCCHYFQPKQLETPKIPLWRKIPVKEFLHMINLANKQS